MKKIIVLLVCLAMAAPAFAYTEWNNGGGDGLWSTAANWSEGLPDPADKTAIGEFNYPSPAENTVTLNSAAGILDGFEVYGGGVLNIVAGGSLTVDAGGDRGIYIQPAPHGDFGSAINLLGGSFTVIDMAGDGFDGLADGMFGEFGLTIAGGGINVDTSVGGQTTYTATPEPATMLLLGLGGLVLRRRRRA